MMLDGSTIIQVIALLCGSTTIVTFILYRKQQKRFKTAEAFEKEVIALRGTMETLQNQITFQAGRIDEMQKLVISKDMYIEQLSSEKHIIEVKHAKNKSAINTAYACTYCKDKSECPVLKKRAENEEAYLKEINTKIS